MLSRNSLEMSIDIVLSNFVTSRENGGQDHIEERRVGMRLRSNFSVEKDNSGLLVLGREASRLWSLISTAQALKAQPLAPYYFSMQAVQGLLKPFSGPLRAVFVDENGVRRSQCATMDLLFILHLGQMPSTTTSEVTSPASPSKFRTRRENSAGRRSKRRRTTSRFSISRSVAGEYLC